MPSDDLGPLGAMFSNEAVLSAISGGQLGTEIHMEIIVKMCTRNGVTSICGHFSQVFPC